MKLTASMVGMLLTSLISVSGNAQSDINLGQDSYSTTVIATGFTQPWASAFLPNGDILVTERAGEIKIVRNGQIVDETVANVPNVYFAGQGGLLDIMLDAQFPTNNTLYLSYASGSAKDNATRLVSAQLDTTNGTYELKNIKNIFTASPTKQTPQHYSGRIAQLADNTLLLGIGDGFDYREQAQKLDSHLGKIIRIDRNGNAPADNPFINREGAKPEIWSYGHRNHQSLLVANGIVYQNEHGPKGGDEVNIIEPGLNYGWPVISLGRDYNGAKITPYEEYPGMRQASVYWTPSIAPSSMAYQNGDLYVTSLAEQSIRRLTINGEKISDQGIVFPKLNSRMRDITTGPDGQLYVLTDGDQAQLIKITHTLSK